MRLVESVTTAMIVMGFWGLLASVTVGSEPPADKSDEQATKTPSGLRYIELRPGTGKTAKAGDTVEVFYTGWLASNGQQFDSNVGKDPFPVQLGVGKVIAGFDEGLTGMREGAKRKLLIPANLGYGARGAGGVIPPNADLIFEVELHRIR